MSIYLDYAAATPIDDSVLAAMKPFFSEQFYNPSALYQPARIAKEALELARHDVAQLIGSRPSEVTFTAGGTESANLAIRGIMERFPEAEVLTSSIEHEAVMEPAKQFRHRIVPVDHNGVVIIAELPALIKDNTVLLSIMYANNEVGTVQPIKDIVAIAQTVRDRRKEAGNSLPLYVYTDACQAPQYLDINVARLGVDLMTLNGGKIYGPKQSGILYHKINVMLEPQVRGGGQEYGLRSGTENVASCVGFAKALALITKNQSEMKKHVQSVAHYFISKLEDQYGAVLNGHKKLRLPHNIHVTFPECDNERVLFSLDDQGIYAAAGSACSASNDDASHVLLAMGKTEQEARASIRFSIGKETSLQQIDKVVAALSVALKA